MTKTESRQIEKSANSFFGQMQDHFGGDPFGDCFDEDEEPQMIQPRSVINKQNQKKLIPGQQLNPYKVISSQSSMSAMSYSSKMDELEAKKQEKIREIQQKIKYGDDDMINSSSNRQDE